MKALIWACLFGFALCTKVHAGLHESWNTLLQRHVQLIHDGHATTVNYAGFKRDHELLTAYLAKLSDVSRQDYDAWPKAKQLAFLINAYNAFTVELILGEYPEIDSIKDVGSFFFSPWKKKFIPLLGTTMSLDDIEHGTIREQGVFDEPRIHFAVNCASIGCPALRNEAFTEANIEAQLDEQTRRFLSDKSRNYVSDTTLYLSKIFDWYEDDFSPEFFISYAPELGLTESQQAKLKADDLRIRYTRYDWSLNSVR